MGKTIKITVSAAVSILALAAAPATAGPHSVKSTAVQIVYPNSGPREVRDYRVGEAILDLPLLWWFAATLGEEVTVESDGASTRLPAGTVLPLHLLDDGAGAEVRAWCTPRHPKERAAHRGMIGTLLEGGSVGRGIKGATDRQLCIIDSDEDGRADSSLAVSGGSPAARTPRPIPPAAIEIGERVPISDKDRLRISLARVGGKGDWAEFNLKVVQLGRARVFDSVRQPWGTTNAVTRVGAAGGFPVPASIFGADFSIRGIDPANRKVRIEWASEAPRDRFAVIPDKLRWVSR